MKFANLHVLHIYQYSKPTGKCCPLAQFTQHVHPLMVSTCMRHIYIFTAEQLQNNEDSLLNLEEHLNNPGLHQIKSQYDFLQGSEAYTFLLYWVLGWLNNKKPFDDVRILGNLRSCLRDIETSNSAHKKSAWQANKLFANCLLKDSKYLQEWIQTLSDNMELPEKDQLVTATCKRCTWAHEQGLLALFNTFNYANFVSEELMMNHIQELIVLYEKKSTTERQKICDRKSSVQFIISQSIIHIDERLNKIAQCKEKFGAFLRPAQAADFETEKGIADNTELVRNHNT